MHSFSTINKGEQSELSLNQFMPRERAPFTHWIRESQRWSKTTEKTKILSYQKSKSSCPGLVTILSVLFQLSQQWHWSEVTGQLHVYFALPLGKKPPVSTEWEAW